MFTYSSAARLKCVWLAITGKSRRARARGRRRRPPGPPVGERCRPGIGFIRNREPVFERQGVFRPGAGASVRTSLPVPHEGRPAPTASA